MFRNRVLLALAIIGGMFILVTAMSSWPSVMGAPSPAHSIVGSWAIVPTTRIPGRAGGEPELITFTSDGTILWSNPLGSTSAGHGVWTRTGDRTSSGTFIVLRRNAAGDFIGTSKIRANWTLNATYDAFIGSGKVDRFDAQGKVVKSFDFAEGHGTRIKVESP